MYISICIYIYLYIYLYISARSTIVPELQDCTHICRYIYIYIYINIYIYISISTPPTIVPELQDGVSARDRVVRRHDVIVRRTACMGEGEG